MAKTTIAEVLQKVLLVQKWIREGQTLTAACKAAGVTGATYKRWITTHAALILPRLVRNTHRNERVAFSSDSRWMFTVADTDEGFALARIASSEATQDASALHVVDNPTYEQRQILALQPSANGDRLLFVTHRGAIHRWDVDTQETVDLAVDIIGRSQTEYTLSGSAVRRWSSVVITPSLEHLLFWRRNTENDEMRLEDGEEIQHFEVTCSWLTSPIELHPMMPWVAVYDQNKIAQVFDYSTGDTIIERGPQLHSISFGADKTFLYDDWYGRTQSYDLESRTSRVLAQGWNSVATDTDRFITADDKSIVVRSKANATEVIELSMQGTLDLGISRDGRHVYALADKLCVWDLTHLQRVAPND
jgi:WD40 repeat protein